MRSSEHLDLRAGDFKGISPVFTYIYTEPLVAGFVVAPKFAPPVAFKGAPGRLLSMRVQTSGECQSFTKTATARRWIRRELRPTPRSLGFFSSSQPGLRASPDAPWDRVGAYRLFRGRRRHTQC